MNLRSRRARRVGRSCPLLMLSFVAALVAPAPGAAAGGASTDAIPDARAVKGVIVLTDARRARAALVLAASAEMLRRRLSRHLLRGATTPDLKDLEDTLIRGTSASASQVARLVALRSRSSRRGTYAALFGQPRLSLALVEGSPSIVRRLHRAHRGLAVALVLPKRHGCAFEDHLLLPVDRQTVASHRLFISAEQCRMAQVIEVDVSEADAGFTGGGVVQGISLVGATPLSKEGVLARVPARASDHSVGHACITTDFAGGQTCGPELPGTPLDIPTSPDQICIGPIDFAGGYACGPSAPNPYDVVPIPDAGSEADPVIPNPSGVGYAWPDEIVNVIGDRSVPGAPRARYTRSAGRYETWYEDPPGKDVTRVWSYVDFYFGGGCVHNPADAYPGEYWFPDSGWGRESSNWIENDNCGSIYGSIYAKYRNPYWRCNGGATYNEYDRTLLFGYPDGSLDGSHDARRWGGCSGLLHFNRRLRREEPYYRCQGNDCRRRRR